MEQIPYLVVLVLLGWHWFADFVLQTHEQAVNKSKSFSYLLDHTVTYSVSWWAPMTIIFWWHSNFIFGIWLGMLFMIITFLLHTLTDYFTSKLNARLWKEERTHDFFVAVGFDQVLHYIQLFVTYKILIELIKI